MKVPVPSDQEIVTVAPLRARRTLSLTSAGGGAGDPEQSPFRQASPAVHGFASSHGPVVSACEQPVAGEHESDVQGLPSSQSSGAWVHPAAGLQESTVQALVSAQITVVCRHPVEVLQKSFVHAFPSLQSRVACAQPATGSHVSVVQMFPSSHPVLETFVVTVAVLLVEFWSTRGGRGGRRVGDASSRPRGTARS